MNELNKLYEMQLRNLDDMKRRAVESVKYGYYETLIIKFTDGTFIVIETITDDDGTVIVAMKKDCELLDLFEAEVIDDDKYKELSEIRNSIINKQKEEREMELYRTLKAKYEKGE